MHLGSPTVATLAQIESGREGINQTLRIMSRFVRDGKKNFAVINKARSLVSNCSQKDYVCEAIALHRFVRDSIRYVQDPNGVELVQEPQKTLEFGTGDCDDKATLLAAMLEAIGHPTRFRVVGTEPGVFSHVYVETKIGQHWIAAETTEPVELGWQPPAEIIKATFAHFN